MGRVEKNMQGGTMRRVTFVLLLILAGGYNFQNACAEGLGNGSDSKKMTDSTHSAALLNANVGDKNNQNWIESVFPSMGNCTPQSYYYDIWLKRTHNGILEDKGYKPYVVDAEIARYMINEKIFGLDAIEIAVPSGTFSSYAITVAVDAKRLFEVVKYRTGYSLQTYRKNFKSQSKVAYIFPVDSKRSMLVCDTREGGDL